jgi:hypothetical protein
MPSQRFVAKLDQRTFVFAESAPVSLCVKPLGPAYVDEVGLPIDG